MNNHIKLDAKNASSSAGAEQGLRIDRAEIVKKGLQEQGGFSAEGADSSDSQSSNIFPNLLISILFWGLLIIGLHLTSLHSYLLFHSIVEIFSIAVTFSIFMIAWNARKFMDNNYFLLIGIASLFLGIVDTFHVLSYKGMGVFVGYGTNLPTQLWIIYRYLLSLSLLAASFFLRRRLPLKATFSLYAGVCGLLLVDLFFWNKFPDCFIEGQGLTTFKIVSEYIISFILILSIAALICYRKQFEREILYLLISFLAVSVATEISFTLYSSPFGFFNFLGHILILFSFYLLYRALVARGLRQPYHLLFRNLKQREEALQESEAKYRLLSEHLEEKVEEKVAELKLAQRLAGLGQMVSVVAHEIRNPLQNINLGVGAIRREVGGNKEVSEILEDIDYGVHTLNDIVTELLDYSRPTSLSVTGWPIGAIIKRALSGLKEKLQHVDVRMDLDQEMREVPIDAPRMIRVFLNLFSNAAEAMPEQGIMEIKSQFLPKDGRAFLKMTISDNGPGIKDEDLERIFEPFFTTKARGTGLGIPICRKIIEAHNGSIFVRSKLEQGTTIEILLPAE